MKTFENLWKSLRTFWAVAALSVTPLPLYKLKQLHAALLHLEAQQRCFFISCDTYWYSAKRAGVKRVCPHKGYRSYVVHARCTLGSCVLVPWFSGWIYIAVNDSHSYSMSLVCSWNEIGDVLSSFAPFLANAELSIARYACVKLRSKRGVSHHFGD